APPVAQRDGDSTLRVLLPDNVLVELGDDFLRSHRYRHGAGRRVGTITRAHADGARRMHSNLSRRSAFADAIWSPRRASLIMGAPREAALWRMVVTRMRTKSRRPMRSTTRIIALT